MKKLLALLLALVMILSLAACGGEEEETRSRRSKKSTEDTTQGTEPQENQSDEEPEDWDYNSPYTEFEELDVTVIDDKYITLTISDMDEGDWGSVVCAVEVENNCDSDITVYTNGVAINGKMVSDSFYIDLEAEDFVEEDFTLYDIEDPEDLTRLSMEIYLYDSSDYDFSESYLIDIYPQGKSAYKDPKPDLDAQDVLVDEDGVYVAVQGYEMDTYGDYNVNYIAVNKTEELINLAMNTVAINGFGFYDYGGGSILPNTYKEAGLWLVAVEDLQLLGMGEVTMLEMDFKVNTDDDKTLFAEMVTLYPNGKSKAKEFVYDYEDDDVVVAETMDFKLTQVKVVTDDWDDVMVYFVLENKSGHGLSLTGEEMKINGKDSDNWFYCNVEQPMDTYEILYIYSSELEELKLDKVESIEMKLEVRDEDYDVIYEEIVEFDVK